MCKSKNKLILYLLASGILLLHASCVKRPHQVINPGSLNVQEQKLIGKWFLKRSETFEVTGTDSSGQYQYNLIGSSTCDSLCTAEFKAMNFGAGSIGGCDVNASFTWKIKQQNIIETGNGNHYDIIYLSDDSVAFSNVFVKDILTLRSVAHYKKK